MLYMHIVNLWIMHFSDYVLMYILYLIHLLSTRESEIGKVCHHKSSNYLKTQNKLCQGDVVSISTQPFHPCIFFLQKLLKLEKCTCIWQPNSKYIFFNMTAGIKQLRS